MKFLFPVLMASVLLVVSGCAAVREVGIDDSLLNDRRDVPFIETAIDNVASSQEARSTNVSANPGRNDSGRAYSGTPDGVTLKAMRSKEAVELRGAESYLHSILDRLLASWPFQTPPIGIFIVNQEGFEAQATAGRDILITTGMIRDLESEDELAAVLAHEVSHILLDHHARAEDITDNKRILNIAAETAIYAYIVQETDWQKTGDMAFSGNLNFADIQDELLQVGGVCLASTYFIDKIVDPSWTRDQEKEADLLGIDLMIKAGYNPAGAVQAMRRRVEYEGKAKSIVDRRIASGDYEKMMDQSVKEDGFAGFITGAARVVTAGVTDTFRDIDNYISRRHELSKDRLKDMQLYLERHYPDRKRKALEKRRFQSVFRNQYNKAVLSNHKKASDSHRKLNTGQKEAAYKLARASTRPPTSGSVAPRMAMYNVLSAQNRKDDAFKQLLKIDDLDNAPAQTFDALAEGYHRRGNIARAEEMKKRAEEKRKSIYDEDGEKGLGFLADLSFGSQDGANRFQVSGFCDGMRDATSGFARRMSGD